MKDKLGQDINVGDYIVYGSLLGRCAALKVGKVLALKHTVEQQHYGPQDIYRITVQGVDDTWTGEPIQLSQKGTLQFPDRCMVIQECQLPKDYANLLVNI